MGRTCEQAWLMGAHIVFAQQAVGLDRRGDVRVVRLFDGTEVVAPRGRGRHRIEWRRLGVPRLEALVGSGVFYGAAVAESRGMAGQDVFVVGAATRPGRRRCTSPSTPATVTLVVRGDGLSASMSSYLVRELEATPNVGRPPPHRGRRRRRRRAARVAHPRRPRAATVEEVPAAALFIMIGGEPHTAWLPERSRATRTGIVSRAATCSTPGCPRTLAASGPSLETSLPGVFAAGDVRQNSIKRVASAVGDGATVVRLVHGHLRVEPVRERLHA